MRGPSGIWNEETLAITDWEAPSRRVVIPESLQLAMSLGTPVLRWDAKKATKLWRDRPRDAHVRDDLTRYLAGWEYCGEEKRAGNIRVLFQDEDGRWYAFSMGVLQRSFNAITVVGGSDAGFLNNRLRGKSTVRSRNE